MARLLVSEGLALLGQESGQAVEGVLQARLIDWLQARLAAADARALVLVVAQAHIVLVCLHADHSSAPARSCCFPAL